MRVAAQLKPAHSLTKCVKKKLSFDFASLCNVSFKTHFIYSNRLGVKND